MNKDKTQGTTEQVKGKVNEVVGHITGNKMQEVKGDLQQGLGKAQKVIGDAREEAKDHAKHDAKHDGTVRNFVCEATMMEMEPLCHANQRHHHANCRQSLKS